MAGRPRRKTLTKELQKACNASAKKPEEVLEEINRSEEFLNPTKMTEECTAEGVFNKMKDRIMKMAYLNLEDALYGELSREEFLIAEREDFVNNEDLQYYIKSRKAKLKNMTVKMAVNTNKVNEAFKLLTDNDQERAKLNSRTEVKEDTNKKKQITIIHSNN